MELLKQRIRSDGRVLPGNILKVSNFLNHQIDIELLDKMGEEFARRFADCKIDRVLTIEASGIAVAYPVARALHVPMVFCKKNKTKNVDEGVYSVDIHSFTHGRDYTVVCSKDYLPAGENVLIIDDFLANGCALEGLAELIRQAGSTPVGAGIVIEKGFQEGGKLLREKGLRVESLAIIESMSPETGCIFR